MFELPCVSAQRVARWSLEKLVESKVDVAVYDCVAQCKIVVQTAKFKRFEAKGGETFDVGAVTQARHTTSEASLHFLEASDMLSRARGPRLRTVLQERQNEHLVKAQDDVSPPSYEEGIETTVECVL